LREANTTLFHLNIFVKTKNELEEKYGIPVEDVDKFTRFVEGIKKYSNYDPFKVIEKFSDLDALEKEIKSKQKEENSMTYNNSRKLIESLLIQSAKMTEGIITSSSSYSKTISSSSSSSIDTYVILKNFDDYGATYELRAYTNRPNEYQKLQSEIRKNIYDRFQQDGLDLTVPQAQIDSSKMI
jgi:small-conductance mechanosensitive channel